MTQDRSPNRLFRFRPPNNYTLKELSESSIWASKPAGFNDPFECQNIRLKEYSIEEYKDFLWNFFENNGATCKQFNDEIDLSIIDDELTPYVKDKIKIATEAHYEHYQNVGIICFSENPNDILMWSHYASSHTGILLEFDVTNTFRTADSMIYNDDDYRPLVDPLEFVLYGDNDQERKCFGDAILLTKSTHWKYEQEWRVFSRHGDQSEDFLQEELVSITFGCKCDHEFILNVKDATKQYTNLEFKRATLDAEKFKINIEAF